MIIFRINKKHGSSFSLNGAEVDRYKNAINRELGIDE